ncbi:MAG: hypothetical protein Q9M39_07690 [Sulfurovum sp.]|nr:hypothetical protein [Sulfurovum sp.]
MIRKTLMTLTILLSQGYTDNTNDSDFDGVPDYLDQCPQSPFLCEVDKTGCSTTILTLPFETTKENLDITLGYGYSTNEDLIDREDQKNTKLQINYYKDNWSYTLQTGYYSHDLHDGALDTIVRIKKRMRLNSEFVLSLGGGLRLPSYDFEGNKLDAVFYSSMHYYASSALSFFAGYNYTHIGDDEVEPIIPETPYGDDDDDDDEYIYQGLQNIHKFYIGSGYFFTDDFYLNLLYSDESSKFIGEHRIRNISTSLYYKIDKKWFSTLTYSREVFDEDLHENLLLRVGYHIW